LFYCVWSFVVVGCMFHHYEFFCIIALHLDLLSLNSLLMWLTSQVFFFPYCLFCLWGYLLFSFFFNLLCVIFLLL
jgi:hypothetical protein